MITYTLTLKTGEIVPLSRDVRDQHSAEVHAALGTSSEGELQQVLDRYSVEDYYDARGRYTGPDKYGVALMRPRSALTTARQRRTRRANNLKRLMLWMGTHGTKRFPIGQLPPWWPFWSDRLYEDVRRLVRAARFVVQLETVPRLDHQRAHRRPESGA